MERNEFIYGALHIHSFKGTIKISVGFSGSAGGQMGGGRPEPAEKYLWERE
jgi:hypothetical protein